MFGKMKEVLKKVDADYADLRYEKKVEAGITFRTRDVTSLGKDHTDGFVLRVLKNGGFATVAFNDIKDADFAVRNAVTNAELCANKATKKVGFAKAPVVKDDVIPVLIEDPRKVSFDEKLDLMRKYNEILLSRDKVIATDLEYEEINRDKWFINTEGSEIHEELVSIRLGGMVTSSDGKQTQNLRIKSGGSNGFQNIRNLEKYFEGRSKIASDLLEAEAVKGGIYDCIIDPELAGVLTHEAFGHLSEADIIEYQPSLREKMKIGDKLGSDIVNITDDATIPNQLGYYKYDDEGVEVRKTSLMRKGVLTGRLHSRKTAFEFNEPVSGHMIAEDQRYAPIIRMVTIFIEPAENTKEDLFKALGNGLYLLEAKGGQTAGENFTFGASYGYVIEDGKIMKMLKDINISGNLFQTLKDITMIGDDLVLSKVGGCGKGQVNFRSCNGAPHIIVKNLNVGGK